MRGGGVVIPRRHTIPQSAVPADSSLYTREPWNTVNTMDRKHNRNLVPLAKSLRKEMTREERRLWYDFLRSYTVKFNRQKVLGKYIADFYSSSAKLVIELDGSQHFEDEEKLNDAERTAYLEQYGLEINQNFNGVCEYIDMIVKQKLNTASPV